MTTQPLISIIVPVYNIEKYLRACVESILDQTYRHLEIILVNDGSTDSSNEICKEYEENDIRVVVVEKSNGGLSDARNAGLDLAQGDFIAFVDGDDILDKDFIYYLKENIGHADMIFCGFHYFEEEEELKPVSFKNTDVIEFKSEQLLTQITTFKYPLLVLAWNKLYKKDVWKEIRFPKGKIHEDEYLVHHMLDKTKHVKFFDAELYHYRQRTSSIMAGKLSEKAINDKFAALVDRREFFDKKGMQRQRDETNVLILSRCAARYVKRDNHYWRQISMKDIVKEDKLPVRYKIILLLKKVCYPMYKEVMHLRHDIS